MKKEIYCGPARGLYEVRNFLSFLETLDGHEAVGTERGTEYLRVSHVSGVSLAYINWESALGQSAKVHLVGEQSAIEQLERRVLSESLRLEAESRRSELHLVE